MRAAARIASAATASMVAVGNAAHVDDEMSLAGNLARSMHRRIGIELPRGDHEIGARLLLLQPDALQMVQQRHGRGDCVMTMRTVDRTGMTVLTDAAGVAKSLAAADPGHHRGRQLLGHQRRTLLDVEFQIGADTRCIEQTAAAPGSVAGRSRARSAWIRGSCRCPIARSRGRRGRANRTHRRCRDRRCRTRRTPRRECP